MEGYILFSPEYLFLIVFGSFILGATVIAFCVNSFLGIIKIEPFMACGTENNKSDEQIVEEFAYQAGTDGQPGVFFESGTSAEQARTDYNGSVTDSGSSGSIGDEAEALRRLEKTIQRATAKITSK